MKKILVILILIFIQTILMSFDISETLNDFGEYNGALYLQPGVNTFGINLNAGL